MEKSKFQIPGARIGHAQNLEAATGCTVILTPEGAVCGVDPRLSNLDRLWMVQLDGSDNHPVLDDEIARNDYAPAFSPDGSKLAYISDHGGIICDIMVYDLETGEAPVNLTNFPSFLDMIKSPFFDSTGQWIYYFFSSEGYSINRISVSGGVPGKVLDITTVDLTHISSVPAYNNFNTATDSHHFVLTGPLNDAYKVFIADSLDGSFVPEVVTDVSYDCRDPFWHRP